MASRAAARARIRIARSATTVRQPIASGERVEVALVAAHRHDGRAEPGERSAVTRPMPLVAPVTTIVLPEKSIASVLPSWTTYRGAASPLPARGRQGRGPGVPRQPSTRICILTTPAGALAASSKAPTLSSKAKVRVISGATSMAPDASMATQRGNTWA